MTNWLHALRAYRANVANAIRNMQYDQQQLTRQFQSPRPTRLIWNVRNHLKRSHIPTRALEAKAIEYITNNPHLIGTTVRLYF